MIMADVAAAAGRTPAERLARMVRCRTVTQPEGGDPGEFRRLHAVLEEDYPLVHRHLERTRVRGESLLYRWPGRGPDPAARPTVLMAHQDVVEATGPWGRPPFDGVVAKIHVKVGEAIALGMPLVKMVDDSEYYVKAPFDEANAADIRVGQVARINIDAYRGTDFPGVVEFISPIVAQNLDLSRTLDIDVRIEDGQDKFVAGMSADVIIVAEKKQDVLYVPSEALIREQTAYVIEDGRVVVRNVEVGIGNMLTKEVLSGLKEGETIVTSVTVKGLQNGIPVMVVDELGDE